MLKIEKRNHEMDLGFSSLCLSVRQEEKTELDSGPVTVGWMLAKEEAAVIFDPPKRLASIAAKGSISKSASRCPAIHNFDARYFVVKSPYDLHIGFVRGESGKPGLENKAGDRSSMRASALRETVIMMPEKEWVSKDKPIIQIMLPYLFLADEPVYLSQLPSFSHFETLKRPGLTFCGRFPIHTWPRQLMWAFEWHDLGRDLIIRRGEPLFYCHFEGPSPNRAIQLQEAEMTDELSSYLSKISGAVNYVDKTFSLFKSAERIRPEKLFKAAK